MDSTLTLARDRIAGPLAIYDRATAALAAIAPATLATMARLAFAGVLAGYFWQSALTKLGDGPLGLVRPSLGAYAQIFPRRFEAVGYDLSQLTLFHWAVVEAGMLAEFLLPLLIVIGLLTRFASLGMIGFIAVQTLTDIYGHGVDAATVGQWFDRDPAGLIADQRALWALMLLIPLFLGAGPISTDRLLRRRIRASA